MKSTANMSQISLQSTQEAGQKFADEFSKLSKSKSGSELSLKVATELLIFMRSLRCVPALLKTLTDVTKSLKGRQKLVDEVLKSLKPEKITVAVLQELVSKRWSKESDFDLAVLEFFFSAMVISMSCNSEKNRLAQVSSELFQISEILKDMTKSSSDVARVRKFLSSENRSVTGRWKMLDDFLGSAALPETLLFAKSATLRLDNLMFVISLRRICEKISQVQNNVLVLVTTAVEMTHAQEERLEQILRNRFASGEFSGKNIQMNVIVDPSVLGGMKIEVDGKTVDATLQNNFKVLQQQFEVNFKV